MSSRVQKGNTVFRPVARPRPLQSADSAAPSRQASAVPDTQAALPAQDVSQESAAGAAWDTPKASPPLNRAAVSMPPPALPQRPPSVAPSTPVPSSRISTTPIAIPTPGGSRRPPAIVSASGMNQENGKAPTPRVTVIQTPSRERSRPPAVPERVSHGSEQPAPPLAAPVTQESPAQTSEFPIDNATAVAALTQLAAALQTSLESQQDVRTEVQPEAEPMKGAKKRRNRRTAVPAVEQTGEGEASSGPPKRRRRTSSAATTVTVKRSRTRQPSVPPFDPAAGPGEELDPTVVTMAALCDDTGQGRISSKAAQIVSNHAAWRTANREKRAKMRVQAEARKYGRDDDEGGQPAKQQTEQSTDSQPSEAGPSNTSVEAAPNESGSAGDDEQPAGIDGFDYGTQMAKSRYAVQVRIGPNGETIIDEDSLFVDRAEEADTADYVHVEESDTTKFVNSATYSRKLRGSRWSAEETDLFYDALMQFGENYELISYVLPGRDRRQCKNKFKAEDRKNPARITYCLNNRKPYDMQTLSRLTGKDFSGPTPVITAPVRLRLDEDPDGDVRDDLTSVNIAKKPPTSETGDEEILGSIEDEQEELPDSLFAK